MSAITREHLELAALAAGYAEARYEDWPGMEMRHGYACAIWTGERYINPAEDDGDAARLAGRLYMRTDFDELGAFASADPYPDDWSCLWDGAACVDHDGTEPDKLRAWREAVTLCAAAVGERMRGER